MVHRFSLLFLVWLVFTSVSSACPFCSATGKTFGDEAKQAHVILYGTLKDPKRDPKEFGKGTTDLHLEVVIKDQDFIKDQKVVTLPRYVPIDAKAANKYLVFCEVYKGQLDPYRGIAVDPTSKIAEYLKQSLQLKEKDVPAKLLFYFNYLDSNELDISNDALMEFGNADYKDVLAIVDKLPAKKLADWLLDDSTPASRLGLYGSLLGHCGSRQEHASLFEKLLSDPKKRTLTGIDGMMAGYLMLAPQEGRRFIQRTLEDKRQTVLKTGLFSTAIAGYWTEDRPHREEFLTRYAALRALRFYWQYRKDIVPEKEVIDLLTPLLSQEDISDLVMDDFRRWKQGQFLAQVIALHSNPIFDQPINKRAVIRYCLTFPEDSRAAEFIKARRAEDADLVRSVEELLEQAKELPGQKPN